MADAAKDFRKKQKQKKQSLVKGAERVGIYAASALGVLSVLLLIFIFFAPGPKAHEGNKTVFIIDSGEGAGKIADNLGKAHLVRVPFVFKTFAVLTNSGKKFIPGEFEIPSGATPLKVLNILANGDALKRKITIPEGWTVNMAYKRIAENQVLTGDLPIIPKEGYMAPDTYPVKRGETRAMIIQQMVDRQNKILDDLWLERSANLPIRSKEEALVLASIVEKETGIASERPQIAAVFLNRLRQGMKLQSDPTIIYGITKGLPLGRKILKSEITQNTPWNTYVIQGLPPTPICNPGKDAIKAVLNPPQSKNLFFVADGSGGHVFAATYEEHTKNVEKWRQIRAQKESMEAIADPNLAGGK